MHIRKNLAKDGKLFLLQLKNIRSVFWIPLAVFFVLIPIILLLTMKKYGDISYVEENFVLLAQYFVPVFSIWWLSFAFIEIVEGEGNEIHYVNHRMKDNLALLWLGLYLAVIGAGAVIAGIWIPIAGMEFLRMAICSCFYVGALYAVMFWSGSMTLSFLVIAVYWLGSTFGGQIPVEWLNCYDTRYMSMALLVEKYVYILLAAIVFYVIGCIGNSKKQKYN